MDKKFYVMPEAEEFDLLMESPLLAGSPDDGTGDTTDQDVPILDGGGDTSELG